MAQRAKERRGPLTSVRVVEFASVGGPVPFAGMVLADLGADVIRIERPGTDRTGPEWVMHRGRPTISLDLKRTEALTVVSRLIEQADALIEGFRPGVMERLGIGPEVAAGINPRLIYCRATGWGQTGPLADAPGHDINYIAITGILAAIGASDGQPSIPLNLAGDFGGGGMFLITGLLAGVIEARISGMGQVVDAAMTEGASMLAAFLHHMRAAGRWTGGRGANLLDGGAHFYNVYECADGQYIAVGAIEPQFYAELRRRCELHDPIFNAQHDRALWPELRRRMAELFLTRSRDAWCALLEGTDACVSPVLEWDEAPRHPQNAARGSFVSIAGVEQPAAAPRFSRSQSAPFETPRAIETDDAAVLAAWGIGGI